MRPDWLVRDRPRLARSVLRRTRKANFHQLTIGFFYAAYLPEQRAEEHAFECAGSGTRSVPIFFAPARLFRSLARQCAWGATLGRPLCLRDPVISRVWHCQHIEPLNGYPVVCRMWHSQHIEPLTRRDASEIIGNSLISPRAS
jgi:hypothetical protein